MDKKVFDRVDSGGFIKETDEPNLEIVGEKKVKLNRRGNELFNSGDIESARRVFQTTGYSDGLIRVGDHYLEHGKSVDALKMYQLAHAEDKSEKLVEKIAWIVQNLLKEEEAK